MIIVFLQKLVYKTDKTATTVTQYLQRSSSVYSHVYVPRRY